MKEHPIGVFDSGYGGLTVMKQIVHRLPEYDYLYLGDNARSPYGTRSFETVYTYTLQCVEWLFKQGCELVILACNTASAKALRTIQQKDLPNIDDKKRVLGVIRPTTEVIGEYSKTGEVGILATNGTVLSNSYPLEISKFYPAMKVYQRACPMWVPLIENQEYNNAGADYFVKKDIEAILQQSGNIDTLLLACTHYPLLINKIKRFVPGSITVLCQGEIVAKSLSDYLHSHPDMKNSCSKGGARRFFTTDSTTDFDDHAAIFYGETVKSTYLAL